MSVSTDLLWVSYPPGTPCLHMQVRFRACVSTSSIPIATTWGVGEHCFARFVPLDVHSGHVYSIVVSFNCISCFSKLVQFSSNLNIIQYGHRLSRLNTIQFQKKNKKAQRPRFIQSPVTPIPLNNTILDWSQNALLREGNLRAVCDLRDSQNLVKERERGGANNKSVCGFPHACSKPDHFTSCTHGLSVSD
jgi:hypothetical protein